jgi:glycosyltransferase involved in cell wall biosynthesis
MPFFSVIIPVYNRYEPVRRAIDSALGQTFRDREIIVVDDGSTDRTPQIQDEYRGRITYVRRENAGVSAARNAGVTASSSPRLAFLDSDDRWLPEKLEKQALYIRERPDVRIHQTNETWIRKGRRVNPGLRHFKKEGDIFIDSLSLCLISPSAVVIERGLFDRYGPFDEDLPVCEDYDLWLKITLEEWVGLVPEELVVRYGGHADQLSSGRWGMDRFRVYSILNLLKNKGGPIKPEYRSMAVEAALKKTRILHQGALKRGNKEFAQKLRNIILSLESGNNDAGEYRFLIES